MVETACHVADDQGAGPVDPDRTHVAAERPCLDPPSRRRAVDLVGRPHPKCPVDVLYEPLVGLAGSVASRSTPVVTHRRSVDAHQQTQQNGRHPAEATALYRSEDQHPSASTVDTISTRLPRFKRAWVGSGSASRSPTGDSDPSAGPGPQAVGHMLEDIPGGGWDLNATAFSTSND